MSFFRTAILLYTLLFVHQLQAQNRFKGGIVAGFNAAQLDGDAAAGYHKVGISGGLRALVELGGRLELSTEILYSQRGSRTTENEAAINRTCNLNYIEVPVLLNIRDWKKKSGEDGEYFKVSFSIGLAYGRLFSAQSNPFFPHAAVVDRFAKNDLSIMSGVNYYANSHWVFSCRIAKSLNPLFNPRKYANEPLAGGLPTLRGHFISFQTGWIF